MLEALRPVHRAAVALAVGVLLSLLAGFGGIVAALAGWAAQPLFALAVRAWRTGDCEVLAIPFE